MKNLKCIVLLLCVTLFFASCKDDEKTTIKVESVTISKTTLSLVAGSSETLTATVLPEDAEEKSVTWSSDKTTIATVDATGIVTAVAAGTATITVTTADGGKTATCAVTVTPATIAVTGVTLNKTTLELDKGFKETLTATVAPADATNQVVAWTSATPAVATVDATTGEVTAVAVGTAVITATTADGGKAATCTVTVIDNSKFTNEGQPGIDGSGWDKAYEIATKDQLILLATRVNGTDQAKWNAKYYKLTADIDFGANTTDVWPMIGSNNGQEFKGYFDGGNHVIKGKLLADPKANYFGLFGVTRGAEIKNIRFEGSIDVSAATNLGNNVAAIVGSMNGGMVLHCSNTANISSNATTGGIVSSVSGGNGKIIACINTGNISNVGTSKSVAGIACTSYRGYVIGCINKGNIVGKNGKTGGIVAYGTAVACWSTANSITSANSEKGCIIGKVESEIGDTAHDCYWKLITGLNALNKAAGAGTITNSASFTGDKPDAAQIAAMNAAWAAAQPTGREYQFNATTGEIEKLP